MYKTHLYIYRKISHSNSVLINTLTGDSLFIKHGSKEENYIYLFFSAQLTTIPDSFLGILKAKYFIYNSKDEELNKIQSFEKEWKAKIKRKAMMFCFSLTYLCNSKCSYCYEEGLENGFKKMSKSDIDKAFKAIKYFLRTDNSSNINLFIGGGEPFLKGNEMLVEYLLKQIERFKREHDQVKVYFFTNCTNTNDYIDILTNYRSVITEFLITLIGDKNIHNLYRRTRDKSDAYDNSISVINNLLKNKIPVKIILNIDHGNIHCINSIIDKMKKCGWDSNIFFHGFYPSRIKYLTSHNIYEMNEFEVIDAYSSILKQYEDYQDKFNFGDFRSLKNVTDFTECLSGRNQLFQQFKCCSAATLKQFIFDAHGDIYTCTKAAGKPKYSIGKYSPELTLSEEKIKWWEDKSFINISKCKECSIALICGGNCVYEAIEKNGNINIPTCPPIVQLIDYFLCQPKNGFVVKDFVN